MIDAGYRERGLVVETVACGLVDFVELGGCGEVLCEDLSLDCLGPRTPSALTAKFASDVSFDPGLLGMFLVSGLEPSAGLTNPKQLHCDTFKWLRTALIFVAMVPEGAPMRMSHMPVASFPMSIKVVKTTPRQSTAPVNMRLTGIEKPIEA